MQTSSSKCLQLGSAASGTLAPRSRACRRRHSVSVSANQQSPSWDPEGLFKNAAPAAGLIERKLMLGRASEDQEGKKAMESVFELQRVEATNRRESRTPPDDHHDLVEYFLDTEAPDMEFEIARCRPKLDKDFFAVIDRLVGTERFSPAPDEDRLAELETLRDYLKEAVEAVDKATAQVAAAPERMRKLLMAKDKKATILQMAGDGEIDQALIDLLQQNIDGAKAADQNEAAEFMTKVQQACMRHVIRA